MNKKVKSILQGILFIGIIIAFIYIGTRDFSVKEIVDSEKFDSEYVNVDKDNVFKYVNASEVYTELKNGSSIIFMGYPKNKWTGYYANILNQVAKESGITEVLYYDFAEDRRVQNGTYQSIVLKLTNYVPALDDGTKNIYAPTLVVVKNGSIIYFDYETAIRVGNLEPKDYWNEYRTGLKMQTLKMLFADYLMNE